MGLATLVALAGCAGGGGGSGTAPPSSPPRATGHNAAAENDIKQPYAVQDGETGAGVTVAVVDTGILSTHEEFKGKLVNPTSTVSTEPSTDYNDYSTDGHGTGVAGVVHETASDAAIMPVRVFDKNGNSSETYLDDGINYAVSNGAKVINLSISSTATSNTTTAITNATNAGLLVVAGAGNAGAANPDSLAMTATDSNVAGKMLVVGSVDTSTNTISSFSDRAGSAANYFLVAPGEGIDTASNTGNTAYTTQNGTSFAAPEVSAAAALLWQKWPTLTNAKIASILLSSATDLGPAGVDSTYGHGLLNLQEAIKPLGTTVVPAGASIYDSAIPVSASSAQLGSAFGDALSHWKLHTIVLDSYQRDYPVLFSSWAKSAPVGVDFSDWFNRARGLNGHWADGNTGLQVRSRLSAKPLLDGRPRSAWQDARSGYELSDLTVAGHFAGVAWQAYHHASALPAWGPAGVPWLRREGAPSAGYGQSLKEPLGLAMRWGATAAMRMARGKNGSRLGVHARLWSSRRWALEALGGWVNEDQLFGTQSQGSLAFGQHSHTVYAGLSGRYRLAQHWGVRAIWRTGVTHMEPAPGSLFTQFSAVDSQAGALALDYQGRGLRAGLVYAQPLRVTTGVASLSVPTSVDAQGHITYQGERVSVRPSGREQDLQGYVAFADVAGGELRTALLYAKEPGHNASAPAQTAVAVDYRRRF